MRKILLALVLLLSLPVCRAVTHKLATINARYCNNGDTGAKSWANRRASFGSKINAYNFDVMGIQEVSGENGNKGGMSTAMIVNIKTLFPNYEFLQWDRSNNGGKTEYVAIAYKKARYNLLANGSFFISPTPETGSGGWDQYDNGRMWRRVGWAKLQDKNSGEVFFFACAHTNDGWTLDGCYGSDLIAKSMRAIAGDTPVIIMGDFNSNRVHAETGRNTRMYKAYRSQLHEAWATCPDIASTPTAGCVTTYNAWKLAPGGDSHLDHAFYRGMKVNRIRICTDTYTYNGTKSNISDHFPVYFEVEMAPETCRTFHVDATAPASGPGTAAAPFRSLSQAVAAAGLDDTIRVAAAGLDDTIRVAAGTYAESIHPTHSVHIFGGYDKQFRHRDGISEIDGSALTSRPIDADEHISLTLSNFLIRDYKSASAAADGAVRFCGHDLVMENVTFRGCTAIEKGGGLLIHRADKYAEAFSISLRHCVFRDCAAGDGGGAFLGYTKSMRLDNCSFENNTATADGAALYINTGQSDASTVWFTDAEGIIYNSSFTGNTGVKSGAIYFRDMMPNVRLNIVNTTIANNTATGDLGGAAIRAELCVETSVSKKNSSGNTVTVSRPAGVVNLGHCTIIGNYSAKYAAVRITEKGTVGIVNNIIAGNTSGTGDAADVSLVSAGRHTTNRTNNVYTATDKASVVFTPDKTDAGAASYAAGMADMPNFFEGTYDGKRFTAALSYDRLTPQPLMKAKTFGGKALAALAPTARNLESMFATDLNGNSAAAAPLRKDQNGNFRKYSSVAGANEFNPTRRSASRLYFASVSGAGNQDGTTWNNALAAGDLVTVLPMIEKGDTLCLKAGTYSASQAALDVNEGATIVGGFPDTATGDDISAYDPWNNPTVFDARSKNNGTPFLTVTGRGKWSAVTPLGNGNFAIAGLTRPTACSVVTLSGTVVLTRTVGSDGATISLADLPRGVYLLTTPDSVVKIVR